MTPGGIVYCGGCPARPGEAHRLSCLDATVYGRPWAIIHLVALLATWAVAA